MPIAEKVFEQFVIDGVACQETKSDRITVGIGRPKAEQVRGRIHRGATPPEDARAAAHRILAAAGMGASASSSAGEPSSSMKDSEAAQARAAAAMRYDLFGDSESSSIKHLLDGVDALVERKRRSRTGVGWVIAPMEHEHRRLLWVHRKAALERGGGGHAPPRFERSDDTAAKAPE